MNQPVITYQEICEIIDAEIIQNVTMGTDLAKYDGALMYIGAIESTQRAMALLTLKYRLANRYYELPEKNPSTKESKKL